MRREIAVGAFVAMMGCAVASMQEDWKDAQPKAVDVHSHNVLSEYKQFLAQKGAALDETFPLPEWGVDAHLQFMQESGIGLSVLSMPAPQPWFGDAEECKKVVRHYNEACARLKAENPEKFLFLAALPLPDMDAAIEEAIYALDTLGADGIKLATNSRGQYVGEPEMDRLMDVLNARKAVVFLHPHKPVPVNDNIIATSPLAIYEYPAETTRTLINMIARNVPARYADVRFIVPHCGSFLPLALPRMKAVHPAMQAKGLMQPIDWERNMSNLYFDLAGGASPEIVKMLLTITTPDKLLYGSDYPYQSAPVLRKALNNMRQWLASEPDLAPYADDILRHNALRLFGRAESEPQRHDTQPRQVSKQAMQPDGIVRLSHVEVYPQHLEEYLSMAAEVGEISLLTEPGVLTMYAVAEKENPCNITILEIYASQEAYKAHIASSHFQKYKQGTLHMVKDLKLIDQNPLNPDNHLNNFIKRP